MSALYRTATTSQGRVFGMLKPAAAAAGLLLAGLLTGCQGIPRVTEAGVDARVIAAVQADRDARTRETADGTPVRYLAAKPVGR